MISLDAALRMEGIPALEFWEMVLDVFCPLKPTQLPIEKKPEIENINDAFAEVNYVPPNVQAPNGSACVFFLKITTLSYKYV